MMGMMQVGYCILAFLNEIEAQCQGEMLVAVPHQNRVNYCRYTQ